MSCTELFMHLFCVGLLLSSVNISRVTGCEERLWNDPNCGCTHLLQLCMNVNSRSRSNTTLQNLHRVHYDWLLDWGLTALSAQTGSERCLL